MKEFQHWFQSLSVHEQLYAQAGMLVMVLLLAWLGNFITKKVILHLVHKLVKKSKIKWDDILVKHRVFALLSHLVPPIIIYVASPFVFLDTLGGGEFMRNIAVIYMLLIGALIANAFLTSMVDIYRSFPFSGRLPIRGFVQVIKIIIFIVVGVVIIGQILGRNPASILAGFGAMTAVTMLIFKDIILGLVASIQLSANDMVRLGDWITMPRYDADGDVIDISLTTVKVQNWDKTISTIPAYSLISDSFKNWRGMAESDGRRIKRSINIDMNTICFCDEAMLEKFRKIQYLTEYIDSKKREIDEHNKAANVDDTELVNGRRMTNIGTFRAYVSAYLKHHPEINLNMTFIVRHLKPTEHGLPIEIYVFCKDKAWANYENIQADIFDHILAVVPEFGLRVFQNPSGADFAKLSLSPDSSNRRLADIKSIRTNNII